jgi:hypothetical protein
MDPMACKANKIDKAKEIRNTALFALQSVK